MGFAVTFQHTCISCFNHIHPFCYLLLVFPLFSLSQSSSSSLISCLLPSVDIGLEWVAIEGSAGGIPIRGRGIHMQRERDTGEYLVHYGLLTYLFSKNYYHLPWTQHWYKYWKFSSDLTGGQLSRLNGDFVFSEGRQIIINEWMNNI